MRLSTSWLPLLGITTIACAAPIETHETDYFGTRTKVFKDFSGKGYSDDKYFHESIYDPHYDGRFADRGLTYAEGKKELSNLVQTYLSTCSDIGVETWLMHGSLLGWWWNRKVLPWDSDVDMQVAEESMHFLAAYYNMSVFHYKTPRMPSGRDYLLEVNPHYRIRDQSDGLNVIDARWIDTETGLFIDITTVRKNYTHPAGRGILSCKDGHEFRETYLYPLRETIFEGQAAKIPYGYGEILEAEYSKKALTSSDFWECVPYVLLNHHFDQGRREWIPVLRAPGKLSKYPVDEQEEHQEVDISETKVSDEDPKLEEAGTKKIGNGEHQAD